MSAITFSDVLIVPSYSEILSRSDVDLRSTLFEIPNREVKFFPIISSNMKHVTGPKMCATMASMNALGILHRFDDSTDQAVDNFKQALELTLYGLSDPPLKSHYKFMIPEINGRELPYRVGVSIGVKPKRDNERALALYEAGARLFCIDVAHGHHLNVKNMLNDLRKSFGEEIIIIAGNVATSQGAEDLAKWGADIIKVGIGPSPVCQTRRNTGVGVPQFSALINARATVGKDKRIISDGGIKYSGDIAKALIFADVVMVGSILAGTSETPGNVYRDENNQFYKIYGGSASGENKISNGGQNRFVEGMMKQVRFQGHAKHILTEINDHIQSSFSYAGALNQIEFKNKVKWVRISGGSKMESKI